MIIVVVDVVVVNISYIMINNYAFIIIVRNALCMHGEYNMYVFMKATTVYENAVQVEPYSNARGTHSA